jgi:hypothetical protein
MVASIFPENFAFRVIEKSHVLGLFKNVKMQGAQKPEPRGVYVHTLSGTVCSAADERFSIAPFVNFRQLC